MYREHAGPPPPDAYEPARQNARNCGYVQLGIVAMTAFTLATTGLQLSGSTLPAQLGVDPSDVSAAKGWALLGAAAYIVILGAWGGLNCWGLLRRSKLAYVSSIGFAIVTILSCFSAVFGAGLLFLLFKREMKGYFDARD